MNPRPFGPEPNALPVCATPRSVWTTEARTRTAPGKNRFLYPRQKERKHYQRHSDASRTEREDIPRFSRARRGRSLTTDRDQWCLFPQRFSSRHNLQRFQKGQDHQANAHHADHDGNDFVQISNISYFEPLESLPGGLSACGIIHPSARPLAELSGNGAKQETRTQNKRKGIAAPQQASFSCRFYGKKNSDEKSDEQAKNKLKHPRYQYGYALFHITPSQPNMRIFCSMAGGFPDYSSPLGATPRFE